MVDSAVTNRGLNSDFMGLMMGFKRQKLLMMIHREFQPYHIWGFNGIV
jgi:hypothetical protein